MPDTHAFEPNKDACYMYGRCSTHIFLGTPLQYLYYLFLNTSIPQYLYPSIPQYLNTSMYQYLNTAIPQYLNTSLPQYLNASTFNTCRSSQQLTLRKKCKVRPIKQSYGPHSPKNYLWLSDAMVGLRSVNPYRSTSPCLLGHVNVMILPWNPWKAGNYQGYRQVLG